MKGVHFDGNNFEKVLELFPGYVSVKKNTMKLHIFIPFEGDITVKDTCFITSLNGKITIEYDKNS